MEKTKSITFDEAITAVKASFFAFPKLWWRIALVNFLTIVMILLGIVFSGLLFYQGMGGLENIQSLFVNLQMNSSVGEDMLFSHIGLFGGIFVFLIIWVLIFGFLGKISGFLTVENYTKKKTENPFSLYFVKSWAYFWKYVLVALRSFWYVFWPILLVGLLIGGLVFSLDLFETLGMHNISDAFFIFILSFVLILVVSLWRGMNVVFTIPYSIHSDKDANTCFHNGLKIVKGNWWVVFGGFFVMVVVLLAFGTIFGTLEAIYEKQEPLIFYIEGLDFLLNIFIFGPIMVSFMYILMVHLAKIKHIK